MQAQNKNPGSKIKDLLSGRTESRQQQLEENYRQFLATHDGGSTSAAILWTLLGENNHMAVDVIREMRETARYLLGFLAQPKIAKEFSDFRGVNAPDFSQHLVQWINALEWANSPCSRSETALYELSLWVCSEQMLDRMEDDLEEVKKQAA